MTVKLVVLYTQPSDPEAFDRHYFGTHMPLVSGIPGLERTETGKIGAAVDGGEQTYYRVTELYFAHQKALQAGFASSELQNGLRARLAFGTFGSVPMPRPKMPSAVRNEPVVADRSECR